MRNVQLLVYRISTSMEGLAGIVLIFMMLLTTADIIGRVFGRPIIGAYELISFACGIVVAFSIPITSWMKAHIALDLVYKHLPPRLRRGWLLVLRIINMSLFLLIACFLIKMANDYLRNKVVCPTLGIPLYPIAYAMAAACLAQCLVMVNEVIILLRGDE